MANLTKDQRIERDNPNASPYDLLQLGLSEKRYLELMDAGGKNSASADIPAQNQQESKAEDAAPVTPETPKVKAVVIEHNDAGKTIQSAQPKVGKVKRPAPPSGMAWLHNVKTGRRKYMTAGAAQRVARDKPDTYKVVQ